MYYYNRDSSFLPAHSRRVFFLDSVNFVDVIEYYQGKQSEKRTGSLCKPSKVQGGIGVPTRAFLWDAPHFLAEATTSI